MSDRIAGLCFLTIAELSSSGPQMAGVTFGQIMCPCINNVVCHGKKFNIYLILDCKSNNKDNSLYQILL